MHICEYDGCGKTFHRRAELNNHIARVHEPSRQLKCNVDGCDKTFVTNAELKRHMTLHFSENIPQMGGMNDLDAIDMV